MHGVKSACSITKNKAKNMISGPFIGTNKVALGFVQQKWLVYMLPPNLGIMCKKAIVLALISDPLRAI